MKPTKRETLTADITQQVRCYVQDELALAPEEMAIETLEEIEETVMGQTRLILDSLTSEELTSEGAMVLHIQNAVDDTRRLIRDRR